MRKDLKQPSRGVNLGRDDRYARGELPAFLKSRGRHVGFGARLFPAYRAIR